MQYTVEWRVDPHLCLIKRELPLYIAARGAGGVRLEETTFVAAACYGQGRQGALEEEEPVGSRHRTDCGLPSPTHALSPKPPWCTYLAWPRLEWEAGHKGWMAGRLDAGGFLSSKLSLVGEETGRESL